MLNFFNRVRFSYLLFGCIQICAFNKALEAKNHPKAFEFNIDIESFEKMDFVQKLDCFIDLGMAYQKSPSKKGSYRNILKTTYKFLEEKGIELPKKVKRHIKKIIQKRIEDRYFHNSSMCNAMNPDGTFKNETLDRYRNEKPDINNRYRDSVISTLIGVGLLATNNPVGYAAGSYLIGREIDTVYDETVAYVSRYYYGESTRCRVGDQRDQTSNGRSNVKKRDMTRD